MKRTIFNVLSVAMFVVLMLALLISCNNNEPSIDTDSEKEETVIYSVLLKDDRGQLLSDVVSYVFLDDERVDIEAERTSTITTPIKTGERVSSILGMIESKPPSGIPSVTLSLSVKSLPKPPRK